MWLNHHPFMDGEQVLDVGCGNGATACRLLHTWNVHVTAADIRPKMVKNAVARAERAGLSLKGVTASAEQLPFADNSFDGVVCESVLVFVHVDKALKEFSRVIKPNGKVISVEMMALHPVSTQWKEEVQTIYGALQVPDFTGWKKKHRNAGFSSQVLESGPISRLPMNNAEQTPTVADSALHDPQVLKVIEANGRWLERNQHTLGYGVFLLHNQKPAT